MQLIRATDGDTVDRSDLDIFEGGSVWGRALATVGENVKDMTVSMVHFAAGARTKPHRHSGDQVLYVTSGIGRVGAGTEEHTVASGDCVVIPAGELHWHGAGDTGSPMSHIQVQPAGSQTTVEG